MAAGGTRRGGGRPWRSTLARSLLVAALLPQLGILWVLHRPSPTRLPASLVALATDSLLGEATVEVGRATIDRRGEIRLEDLRIGHPPTGARFTGEARITAAWPSWSSGSGGSPHLVARGRLTVPTADGEAVADDLLVRAAEGGAWLDIAARAGEARLRIESRTVARLRSAQPVGGGAADSPGWRELLLEAARLDGGAEIRISDAGWVAEAALRGASGRAGAWRVGALEGWLIQDGGDLFGWARAEEVGFGELEARVLRAHTFAGLATVTMEGGRWAALGGIDGAARLAWGHRGLVARLAAVAGDSRVRVRLAKPTAGKWRAEGISGMLRSTEILRLPGVAEALRRAEIDLAGSVEVGDGTIEMVEGAIGIAEGWIAVRNAGWKDLRPAIIRPDRPEAALTGRIRVDPGLGRFAATELDLAGLAGSIEGGLSAGDTYVVRLASTPGNPVHPGCLDSLLGDWWRDLWRRFDLSTSGTRPHADVVVKGKWGASVADGVAVDATLERFGFMGARFLRTDVRVEALPASTVVHIDRLLGELDGKAAGSARGTVAWDWTTGQVTPRILAEGDLHPLVALRLHEGGAAHAARLRGARLGEPYLKVAIDPTGAASVNLTTLGDSEILGARLGPMQARFTLDPSRPGTTGIVGSVALADGIVTVDLSGDLAGKAQVRALEARGLSWRKVPQALPFLFTNSEAPGGETATLSLSFTGELDLDDTPDLQGAGDFVFEDPQLRRVRLFGLLTLGLDTLGLGFSGYDLTEARGEFRIKDHKATLPRLVIGGEDAELRLAGIVDLNSGGLNLAGDFQIKDSRWGALGLLNPNRLITKVIKIKIGGTLSKPETKVGAGF